MANPEIFRGDTWTRTWIFPTSIDLSNASARLQVRDEKDALFLTASTGTGEISIAQNQTTLKYEVYLQIDIPIDMAPKAYSFDLEVTTADGIVKTYEQSKLKIKADITHD